MFCLLSISMLMNILRHSHIEKYLLVVAALLYVMMSGALLHASSVDMVYHSDSIVVIHDTDIHWNDRTLNFMNIASVNLSNKGWLFLPDVNAPLRDSTRLAHAHDMQRLSQSFMPIVQAASKQHSLAGWYYLRFRVAPELHGKALSFVTSMVGGYDIYIDGRLMVSYGRAAEISADEHIDSYAQYMIRSVFMNGDTNKVHVIALHYSAHSILDLYDTYRGFFLPRDVGVRAVLSYPQEIKKYYDFERTTLLWEGIITGVPLIMIVLHFFFYLGDRKDRVQLYLALYNVGTTLIGFASITSRIHIGQSVEQATIASIVLTLFTMPFLTSIIIVIPKIFEIEFTRIHRIFQYCLIAVAMTVPILTRVFVASLGWLQLPSLIVIYATIFAEMMYIGIRNTRRHNYEAVVMGLGVFFLALGLFVNLWLFSKGIIFAARPFFLYISAYGMFYTVLPIAFSIITGMRFFRQNNALRESMATNERMNRTLQDMNATLEARVQERTQQLIDANEEVQRQLEMLSMQATEIQVVNEALAESNAHLENVNYELVTVNQEKNELLGIAAHDLKNPLTGIKLSVENVLYRIKNGHWEDVEQRIESIGKTAERMHKIISSLLDMNALDSGNVSYHFSVESLGYILHKAVAAIREYAHSKDIALQLLVPADKDIHIRIDKDKFRHILDNLISNAIKYSHPNTLIVVRGMLTDNGIVRIEIEDQGLGIAPDEMSKLFQRFSKLSTQPTGGETSTGLGLSIVKRFVEAMHGTVWAESPGKNQGSIFIMEFPMVQEQHRISQG